MCIYLISIWFHSSSWIGFLDIFHIVAIRADSRVLLTVWLYCMIRIHSDNHNTIVDYTSVCELPVSN